MVKVKGIEYANWEEARAAVAAQKLVESSALVAAEVTPPIIEHLAVSTQPQSPGPRQSLSEKWRPRRLVDLVGQGEVSDALSSFVANPYPCAFLLAGDTGTGKTSAATALAGELGCSIEQGEFGGVFNIPSGENTPAVLNDLWPRLWNMPFASVDGWKLVIVNEIENLNGKVELLWLDRLEDLPPQTCIVFTTNKADSLPARFVDRCIGGVMEFKSTCDDLGESARQLARSIWRSEIGTEIAPDVLERVIARSTNAGRLSFRRVVQHLTPIVAAARLK